MITTPAQATVEPRDMVTGGGERWWRVNVSTPPGWPKAASRSYWIKAFTDVQAGQLGLNRFSEEIDGRPQGQIWMG
jgi:hypothetical protein